MVKAKGCHTSNRETGISAATEPVDWFNELRFYVLLYTLETHFPVDLLARNKNEPKSRYTSESVTHSLYDATPTVTFRVKEHCHFCWLVLLSHHTEVRGSAGLSGCKYTKMVYLQSWLSISELTLLNIRPTIDVYTAIAVRPKWQNQNNFNNIHPQQKETQTKFFKNILNRYNTFLPFSGNNSE